MKNSEKYEPKKDNERELMKRWDERGRDLSPNFNTSNAVILSGPQASGKTWMAYAIMRAFKAEDRVVYDCFCKTVVGTIRQIEVSKNYKVILLEGCYDEAFISLVLSKIPVGFKPYLIFTTLSDVNPDENLRGLQIIKTTYK